MSNRTILIGDVHGCIEELRELLRIVEHTPNDRLIFLGDLVDRGPDPVGVVRLVREELKAESVRGNHDEKIPRWFVHEAKAAKTGKPNPMKRPDYQRLKEWEALSTKDLEWIENLPWLIEFGNPNLPWTAVHAGFEPGLRLSQQRNDRLCRVRYVDVVTGEMAPTKGPEHIPDNSVPWTTWSGVWKCPTRVVYGHAVHDLQHPHVTRNELDPTWTSPHCYGIDTGACFGGHLTAAIYDNAMMGFSFAQVKAKTAYSDLRHASKE